MPNDMGTFRVDIEIENPRYPGARRTIRSVLVDTGAELSWIPADILESLNIERRNQWRFRQADGTVLERWTGPAFVYAAGRTTTDEVVFGEPGDLVLLGARSLEGLNLRVDPWSKRLVDAGPAPAAPSMRPALLLVVLFLLPASLAAQTSTDTIRIEVGSPRLDGRVYRPHAARVNVRLGDSSRVTSTWTNELTVGDSAGRAVHRWVTRGVQRPANGPEVTWELRQTYDARTLAPLAYSQVSSAGGFQHLTITNARVRGTKRVPGDTAVQQVDVTLDRPGFFAGASDLVPLAVGLREGVVITAPVWSPAMTKAEGRIFSVLGKRAVEVEGASIEAWKVEERRESDRVLLATWYLLDKSPYMVYGEVPLPNGQVRKMTEVEIQR